MRYYGHFQKQKGKEVWDAEEKVKCLRVCEFSFHISDFSQVQRTDIDDSVTLLEV